MRFLHFAGIARWVGLVCGMLFSMAVYADITVIAHPELNAQKVSKRELARVFLGESKQLENGVAVKPVDQEVDSNERASFYLFVTGKDQIELRRYWSKRIFSGKGRPPPVLSGDEAIKKWVAGKPGAIGYVDSRFVDTTVKILPVSN